MGQDIYEQIVSTWRFMNIGLFLNSWMKNNPIPQTYDFEFKGITIKSDAIGAFWPTEFIGANNESYFSSHIFFSSAREIISGVFEGISKSDTDDDEILKFNDFVMSIMKDNYDSFNKILRLCRNVMSHNQSAKFILQESDYLSQKKWCIKNGKSKYVLNVNYAEYFGENYPIQDKYSLELDFEKLTEGESFFDKITMNDLMKITLLCGSISECYINRRASLFLEAMTKKHK